MPALFNGALSSKWFTFSITLTIISASSLISFCLLKKKRGNSSSQIHDLQKSLKGALEKCAAERQVVLELNSTSIRGLFLVQMMRAEALRKVLAQPKSENSELISYPMMHIAVVQSCFSTRNGTPRQPLLVPCARACLIFDTKRAPLASLEGLDEYSHCWILYVFHLNTDLDNLWKKSSESKLRVPRLRGERRGVFATRSPHRPSPIGLTVAKIEAVKGNMVLLSGVDLVDGTPVLDLKPYLPYCDSIEGATVPEWLSMDNLFSTTSISFSDEFSSALADCWQIAEKKSLYASADEFQGLIRQVLSWDIRSVSQRNRPHESHLSRNDDVEAECDTNSDNYCIKVAYSDRMEEEGVTPSKDTMYHLILEGFKVSYRIDSHANVVVEDVTISPDFLKWKQSRCNYPVWRD